jgi:hypothetical protein
MRKQTTAILILCLAWLSASVAWSQVGAQGANQAGYELIWWTVHPAGSARGGPYTLESVAGQPEVGAASSDEYTLDGGVWGGEEEAAYLAYLPVILRQ